MNTANKSFRLLDISNRLHKGEILNRSKLAEEYDVIEKTITRDIEDLRIYLAETSLDKQTTIVYDRKQQGYVLVKNEREWLTNQEVLAITKVMLESRAFCKDEIDTMINKILTQTSPVDRDLIEQIVRNEQFHYEELTHKKKLIPKIWEFSKLIHSKNIISITYQKVDSTSRTYEIKPVSIMFSEFYFYLIAYMADETKTSPTTFRIDRILEYNATERKFSIPYRDKFNDGEFRKRVLFMFGGELKTIKFEYKGSLEVVQDKLPTSKVISTKDNVNTISAEVYGDGIYMWLKSQGDLVTLL